ncbi:hypothetical protein [Chitinimonas lacunae]|uniref:Uncharacterized protein n=1 Tax=Chitinimonas lacunae TaxID=1963018 RepID=A0ABV8MLU9_9NEIS
MKTISLLTALILAFLQTVQASSPEAWTAQQQQVVTACLKQSGLRNAKAVGQPIEFDDRVGYTALTVEGRYPQKFMQNQTGRMLCLFDRKSRQAFVAEAGK